MQRVKNSGPVILFCLIFLLPFKLKVFPIFIALFCIVTLLQPDYFNNLKSQFSNRLFVLLLSFYSLHILGLFWSENLNYGYFDITVKLSFLVFPLFFFPVIHSSVRSPYNLGTGYIIAVIAAFLICITRAFYRMDEFGTEVLFYQQLSFFMHPGYFAMHLCLALSFALNRINNNKLYMIISGLLIIGIVLLSSKIGIAVMAMILFYFWIKLVKSDPVKGLSSVAIAIAVFSLAVYQLKDSPVGARVSQMINFAKHGVDDNEINSTTARVEVWGASIDLIRENILFGVGTGDVKDVLVKQYQDLGFDEVKAKKLNSHNQFLQTGVAFGVLGMILLSLIFAEMLRRSLKTRDIVSLSFLTILVLNSLVESILEVEAGVFFFSVFIFLIFSDSQKRIV